MESKGQQLHFKDAVRLPSGSTAKGALHLLV
jgi:hypothetical protein